MAELESNSQIHELSTLIESEVHDDQPTLSMSSTQHTIGTFQSSDPPQDLLEVIDALSGVRSSPMQNQRASFRHLSPNFSEAIPLSSSPSTPHLTTFTSSPASTSAPTPTTITTTPPPPSLITPPPPHASSPSRLSPLSHMKSNSTSSGLHSTLSSPSSLSSSEFPSLFTNAIVRLSLPRLSGQRYELSDTQELEFHMMRYMVRANRGRHNNQDAKQRHSPVPH
ncbi:hypothetical protein HMI55_001997 [Coelomomyces lativittatus]|nr:hypothetical protein HMI56_007665 [Coelomomyces lativittatus]KAJ1516545.1 hypothetical protein HMI55_001997 [Coelomomyces lativittatus]